MLCGLTSEPGTTNGSCPCTITGRDVFSKFRNFTWVSELDGNLGIVFCWITRQALLFFAENEQNIKCFVMIIVPERWGINQANKHQVPFTILKHQGLCVRCYCNISARLQRICLILTSIWICKRAAATNANAASSIPTVILRRGLEITSNHTIT